MNSPIPASYFLDTKGNVKYRFYYILEYYDRLYKDQYGAIETVEDLKKLVKENELSPSDLYRFRGCGDKNQPGKLVLYLFPHVKSAAEQRLMKAELNAGAGI